MRPDDYARDLELQDNPPVDFETLRDEIYKANQKELELQKKIPEFIHVGIFEIHLNEAKGILAERY